MKAALFNWLLLAAATLVPQSLHAADEETKEKSEPAKEVEQAEANDRYTVPETDDVQQLVAFLKELRDFRPKNVEQHREHRSKGPEAAKKAAKRILELEKDDTSEAATLAGMVLLEAELQSRPDADKLNELLERSETLLANKAKSGLERSDALLAMNLARQLEYGASAEAAANAYQKFAKIFAGSENDVLAELVPIFEGSARRLALLGNEMKLEGKTVDDAQFDWASYRGKIVLVDFWATWCGPCIAEIPNVRKNYEAYHERGFDVVGISLDRDREALDKYLEKNQLPWVTLHHEGGKHPMAAYYGISAIPTVLLVDRDGKVVSLRARGEELGKLLEKMIGPAEVVAAAEEPKSAADSGAEQE